VACVIQRLPLTARIWICSAAAVLVAACGSSGTPTVPSTPSSNATSTRVMGLSGDLSFGNVAVGSKATQTLTITNGGNSTLTVSGMSVSAAVVGIYTSSWVNGTIASGASQQVTIQFTPGAAQTYSGALTISSDATSGPSTVGLSGTGIGQTPQASCSYTLSIGATIDGYSSGGSFPVTVTTQSGCSWTVTTATSWIHLPNIAGGTGTGSFTFTADANSGAARTGVVTIAGQTITFNQSAATSGSLQVVLDGASCSGQVSNVQVTVDGGVVGTIPQPGGSVTTIVAVGSHTVSANAPNGFTWATNTVQVASNGSIYTLTCTAAPPTTPPAPGPPPVPLPIGTYNWQLQNGTLEFCSGSLCLDFRGLAWNLGTGCATNVSFHVQFFTQEFGPILPDPLVPAVDSAVPTNNVRAGQLVSFTTGTVFTFGRHITGWTVIVNYTAISCSAF